METCRDCGNLYDLDGATFFCVRYPPVYKTNGQCMYPIIKADQIGCREYVGLNKKECDEERIEKKVVMEEKSISHETKFSFPDRITIVIEDRKTSIIRDFITKVQNKLGGCYGKNKGRT